MSLVRSILRFSTLVNVNPMNHVVEFFSDSGFRGGYDSGLMWANVMRGFLSSMPKIIQKENFFNSNFNLKKFVN